MERRIWVQAGSLTTYANMFTMLVGPAGSGKGVINYVYDLWQNARKGDNGPTFFIGRKSYSKASLVDELAACSKTYSNGIGPPFTYHSLLLAAEEFPVLFPKFDMELLAFLSDIWNAGRRYDERRRTSVVREVTINNPIMTVIMGYQPAVMEITLPPSAWDQGFMRRTVMVWNGSPEIRSIFLNDLMDEILEKTITDRLLEIAALYGVMKWEAAAAEKIDSWHVAGGPPRPTHLRLQSYNNTRTHLIIKLSMIASIAESSDMVIRARHVERAFSWLLEAESLMPEIFRAMKGNSDSALMEELYRKMIELYAHQRPRGINQDVIWKFLGDRIPTNKIASIVTAMEKSGLIQNDPPQSVFWKPLAGRSTAQ